MLRPSKEYAIECPQCHSITSTGKVKPKLYVNEEKGVAHCMHCNYSPTVDELTRLFEKTLGAETSGFSVYFEKESALALQLTALDYLKERFGVSSAEALLFARQFQLGYCKDRDAISIPNFIDGRLQGIKYRHLSDESHSRYTAERGSENGFFILNQDKERKKVFIVEGEFDAMSAVVLGFEGPVIALQTNRIKNETKMYLKGYLKETKSIYLCPDLDLPGRQLVEDCTHIFGPTRIAEMELPREFKDLSQLLSEKKKENGSIWFRDALSRFQPQIERDTKSFFDDIQKTIDFLSDRDNVVGHSSGIPLLDEKLGGGFRPHELTLINAQAKVGKTTFSLQLIWNLLKQDHKIGFASLEMIPATHVKPNLISMVLGKDIRAIEEREKIEDAVSEAIDQGPYLQNLFFFDRYGATPAQDISDWVEYLHEEKGIRHIFLDHVGYSLLNQADVGENANLAKTLKTLTVKFPIHLYAIVQPPKIQIENGKSIRLGKDTLFGSAAWGQAMDNLITLQRAQDKEDTLEVRLAESRFPRSRPGDASILMFYDRQSCRLSC